MKSPKIVDLSERQIQFIAELGGVMTVFTSSTVVG
jgi:hypothetical protein